MCAQNVTSVYKEYLRAVLARHMSVTLDQSLDTFFAAIANAFLDTSD